MPVVSTENPVTSSLNLQMIRALCGKHSFLRWEILTTTAFGRPVPAIAAGRGPRKVIFAGSFHANEWITTPLLLRFVEELAEKTLPRAEEILERASIYCVPMVDPDGVDLVLGQIPRGSLQYEQALTLSRRYPDIPFPDGWKANLLGVDLNLQYPAGWEKARAIKFARGFTGPGPRDYVGRGPLTQREARALAGYTRSLDPALVLAFHTQGRVIYWQYGDYEIPGARALGEKFAAVSGYTLADVPYNSGFAGYKDWFIEEFRRPGYTIEAGLGSNPLEMEQFPEIYRDNLGILTEAALGE